MTVVPFKLSTTKQNRHFHPCVHCQPLIQNWVAGAAASAASPRLPFPRPRRLTLTGESPGAPRPEKRHNPSTWSWVYPLGLLPVGRARNTPLGRHPGGILIRYPDYLNWLLSTQRGVPPLDGWASQPVSEGDPSHPAEKTHFSRLYPQFHCFLSWPITHDQTHVDWEIVLPGSLQDPCQSKELVRCSTTRTESALFLFNLRFNNRPDPPFQHLGVDFPRQAE